MKVNEARQRYQVVRSRFAAAASHLVPDIVLLGFLNEIEENVSAVELIAASGIPHRAFPNARTAFEAGQQALLLVTAPDYDAAGATAWAYHLIRDRKYMAAPRSGQTTDRANVEPEEWFESALTEMEQTWNDFAPGRGALLRDAATEIQSRRRGGPENWTGLPVAPTLRDRMLTLAERHGKKGRSDAADILNAGYGALSRESHPRTRFQPTRITRDSSGGISFEIPTRDLEADRETVLISAASSLAAATLGVAIRCSLP